VAVGSVGGSGFCGAADAWRNFGRKNRATQFRIFQDMDSPKTAEASKRSWKLFSWWKEITLYECFSSAKKKPSTKMLPTRPAFRNVGRLGSARLGSANRGAAAERRSGG